MKSNLAFYFSCRCVISLSSACTRSSFGVNAAENNNTNTNGLEPIQQQSSIIYFTYLFSFCFYCFHSFTDWLALSRSLQYCQFICQIQADVIELSVRILFVRLIFGFGVSFCVISWAHTLPFIFILLCCSLAFLILFFQAINAIKILY